VANGSNIFQMLLVFVSCYSGGATESVFTLKVALNSNQAANGTGSHRRDRRLTGIVTFSGHARRRRTSG